MTHTTVLQTISRFGGALLVAGGLLAAIGSHPAAADSTSTRAYPVSVECAGTTQRCGVPFELTVSTSAVLHARFVASAEHCSEIRVGIQRDRTAELKGSLDVPPVMSAFLAPGGSSQEYTLDPGPAYVGAQRIIMVAEGRVGGCNTGRLAGYSGTLFVTTTAPDLPDLAVTKITGPTSLFAGVSGTYVVTLRNVGTTATTGSDLVIHFSGALTQTDRIIAEGGFDCAVAEPYKGTTSVVRCNGVALAAGASTTVTVQARGTAVGTGIVTASANHSRVNDESDYATNLKQLTVTVK